ncbi:MAG: polysaccharide biosynthesis protein, partial [Terriglobales bacterium]
MGQRILITGGSGFLGRRLALALKKDNNVFLCGRNQKQNMMAKAFTGCPAYPVDVARPESVRDVVLEAKPEIIIHAAATKFVDLAEKQPLECVDVNVIGSENVARVAMEHGVKLVVGISTDKAAPPVRNTYGLTKALMERMFCSLDGKTSTRFVCVRYGNVAWSTGSVLPIWKKMHESKRVIGTTGPEMRRFFFTVDEAVRLVLTAMKHSKELSGKVLSRHMKAALIRDILDIWVKHRGGRWEQIPDRPGERIDEYLIGDLELPFTREVTYDGIRHYVISFNEKQKKPVKVGLSSA